MAISQKHVSNSPRTQIMLTLYIKIHMSCSLLLYKVANFAVGTTRLLVFKYSAQSTLLYTLSTLGVSEALQKCHTK